MGFKRLLLFSVLASLVAAPNAMAQRIVTGHVVATTGEPIGSAHVSVEGATYNTNSDDRGAFSIRVPDGSQVLQVRRLGYKRTRFVLSATANDVKIEMDKDILQLEQMVVTGTVTSVSSVNAANAVSTVGAAQMSEVPAPTIDNDLQGKIAGAVITTNSGAPGGGAQVQLRGVSSINGSSNPLYVVDGVLVSDASIGTGVNSITNAGGGISNSQDQPANRISDINPDDIENIEVLKGPSAGAIYGSKASNGVIVITTKRGTSGKPRVTVQQQVGQFDISHELGLRCFNSSAEATDWWDNVIGAGTGAPLPYPWSPTCNNFEKQFYSGNAPSYQTDITVAGGTPQTTYYLGGTAKRDNAIQLGTYYQRQSLTANISQVIGDRFTVRFNNNFVHSLTDRGIAGNDNSPVVSPGDVFSSTPTWFPMAAKPYLANPFESDNVNVFQDAEQITNPEEVYRYIGSINAVLSAYTSKNQSLDFTFIGGVDAFSDHSRLYAPPDIFVEASSATPGLVVTNNAQNTNANLNLSGQHKYITNAFTATTSFGLRQETRQFDQLLNQGRELPPGITNVNFAVNQQLSETQSLIHDLGYYLQEEFLLERRLLLTAAINTDRSSLNGDGGKFYAYPKFAASYRLPGLPNWINDFKLRAAWGESGNQPPYGYKYTALPIGTYSGDLGATVSGVAGNPGITPETATELEGGFDTEMFHNRLALGFTLYNKQISNLILAAAVAPSSGYTTEYINGGGMRNNGAEYSLEVTPIQTGKFTWVSRNTLSYVWSRVTSLSVPCFNAGAFFGLAFGADYLCTGRSATTLQASDVNAPGGYEYLESAPKYTVGMSNEVTYGPIRLYALLDWRQGGYAVDLTNLYFDPYQTLADTAASNKRFNAFLNGVPSYAVPAGFVKLRELSVSYQLPRSFVRGVGLNGAENVRLQLSGRNLFTWTKYPGYDPEVSNFSSQNIGRFQDVTPYPPSRSFFLSIYTNF